MEFPNDDKIKLIRFYEEALITYGPQSARALHWKNEKSQLLRFAALSHIADLTGQSVLDVGCGVGDLYGYVQKLFSLKSYTGVDIVPGFILEAQRKSPEVNFICSDILSYKKRHDYVLASGTLTFAVSGGKEFYFEIIKHMFALAKKGVGFNVLDSEYYSTDHEYLTYSYDEIASLCETLKCPFVVSAEYEVGDFTVFLYKK